jgi:hypothetical protein
MELELFKKTYTSTMMRLVKKLAEKLESEIKQDLMCENHHVILKAKHKMDDLAEAKMLLSIYDPPKETPEQTNPIDPFEGAPECSVLGMTNMTSSPIFLSARVSP